jgi:hypothetical protein
MSSSSSSSEKRFEPNAAEVKANMEIVSSMTAFAQEKIYKKYERRVQREFVFQECRKDVAQRYVIASGSVVRFPHFQKIAVPVANPRRWLPRTVVTRQYVSLDPMDVLVYSRGLSCYILKISTRRQVEIPLRASFEGKTITSSPDVYREDERGADVTYFKANSLLYRNHDDRIMAYNCSTGLSFYHNGKIVKVNHTSPESKFSQMISCTIGDDLTRAYYAEKNLFMYRGEYYSYIRSEKGMARTYVVHVASRVVVRRTSGHVSYYVVGDNIVSITPEGPVILFPVPEEEVGAEEVEKEAEPITKTTEEEEE